MIRLMVSSLIASASSSPAIGCVGLPQPLSSNDVAAETRAACGAVSWFIIPESTLIALSVWALANDLICVGVFDT